MIGGVVGGIIALLLIITTFILLRRRRRRRERRAAGAVAGGEEGMHSTVPNSIPSASSKIGKLMFFYAEFAVQERTKPSPFQYSQTRRRGKTGKARRTKPHLHLGRHRPMHRLTNPHHPLSMMEPPWTPSSRPHTLPISLPALYHRRPHPHRRYQLPRLLCKQHIRSQKARTVMCRRPRPLTVIPQSTCSKTYKH